MRIILDLQ